jgi:hypothetical protein
MVERNKCHIRRYYENPSTSRPRFENCVNATEAADGAEIMRWQGWDNVQIGGH